VREIGRSGAAAAIAYDVTLVPHDRQRMRFVHGIQLHFQRCSPHFGH
jgi:hypothetical protein